VEKNKKNYELIMNDITKKTNWQTKKLGEVCDIQNGYAFKSKDYVESGFYVIRIGNVQNGEIVDKRPRFISGRKATENKNFILEEGDILISLTGDVGRVGRIRKELLPSVLNQRVGRVFNINENKINKNYLFCFLDSSLFESAVIDSSEGVAQKNTSTKKILEIQIPLPPLPEQRRIVKILDGVFEDVKKAKENAEKNLQNAKELFESYLQGIFESPGKDWEKKKLGEVCNFQNGFAFKSKLFTQSGLPILRISNIQQDKISYNRLVFFNKKSYDIDFGKYEVKKGDLVIAMSGATTGKLAVSDANEIFYLNQRVGKFESRKCLLKEFLYYFLTTKIEENLKISQGAAQPNLSTDQIKNFQIPLPPISEQKAIVKKLDALSGDTKKLEGIYRQKLADLEELKKSVLKKAFDGGL